MKTLWMQRRWLTMYSALFLLVAALGYGTMLRSGHAMLWKLDGVGQYWPTFVYIGRYFQRFVLGLLHGQWLLPAFDLSIGMGDDIIGVLNYYGFGDPLNILAVFVTDTNSPYLFTAMFFLRLYLAGLAFIAYCRCMRLDSCAAVPAALCYVFCGYAIFGGAMYQGWLSTLIYFPLILTGYEITLRGDRRTWLLPLAVAYGALCGYYFLYMCSLCLGAYAAVRSIAIRGRLPVQTLVRRHCFAAAAYVAGLLLAAPIMVPALLEFLGSERRGAFLPQSIFTAEMLTPHSPLLLARMLFDRSVPNMLVNYLYNATRLAAVAALLLPALAHWRRNWRSQEGQCLAALLIAVVALHFPATDYVFNAFVKSFQGDTLRWTFIIHFLLAVILAVVLTGMNDIQDRWKDTWHIHLAGRTLPKWGIAAAASCLVLFELVSGIRALYEGHGFKAGFASTATASVYLASPASVSRRKMSPCFTSIMAWRTGFLWSMAMLWILPTRRTRKGTKTGAPSASAPRLTPQRPASNTIWQKAVQPHPLAIFTKKLSLSMAMTGIYLKILIIQAWRIYRALVQWKARMLCRTCATTISKTVFPATLKTAAAHTTSHCVCPTAPIGAPLWMAKRFPPVC